MTFEEALLIYKDLLPISCALMGSLSLCSNAGGACTIAFCSQDDDEDWIFLRRASDHEMFRRDMRLLSSGEY